MNDQPVNGTDPEKETPHKRQIWMILLVMLASGCAGVMVVIGILWLFRNLLIPA
jgi:hypothetical protein